jgi:hypothetical protein
MDVPTLVAFSSTDRTRRALYVSMFRSPAFVLRLNRYIEMCGLDGLTRFGMRFQCAYAAHMGGGHYLSDQHVVTHVRVTAAPSDDFPGSIVSVGRFECDPQRALYKGAFVVYAHDDAASPPTVIVHMDVVLDVDANCRHEVDDATRRQQKWKEDNAEYIERHTTYKEHPKEMRIYLRPRVHYRYEGEDWKRLNSVKQWEDFKKKERHQPALLHDFFTFVGRHRAFALDNIHYRHNDQEGGLYMLHNLIYTAYGLQKAPPCAWTPT